MVSSAFKAGASGVLHVETWYRSFEKARDLVKLILLLRGMDWLVSNFLLWALNACVVWAFREDASNSNVPVP